MHGGAEWVQGVESKDPKISFAPVSFLSLTGFRSGQAQLLTCFGRTARLRDDTLASPRSVAMRYPNTPRIAIIGAGIAGIICAHALQKFGCSAAVLEKSRGIGGRLATRRTAEGDCFDHGAQYLTARQPAFQRMLQELELRRSADTWAPLDSFRATPPSRPWIVGTPGMSSLLTPLTTALDLHTQTSVTALSRSAAGWHLGTDTGATLGPFDAVVCTAPAAQCQALFTDIPVIQAALAQVRMAPCWAIMLRFTAALPVSFDARRYEAGVIGWLARQSSRPGYSGKPHSWVVHASPAWSEDHLEESAEQVLAQLQQELEHLLGSRLPAISYVAAHRWRYALTTVPLGQSFLANEDGSLYAAGDWCLGARVEFAHASGEAAAAALAMRFQLR
jgi:renalase